MNVLAAVSSKMIHHFKHCFSVYSTTREVKIPSRFLAITYLVLVIMVWCAYIGSLGLDLRKVYQKSCPVHGSMVTKVKGVLSTLEVPDSEFQVSNPELYKRVWDTSDVIYPPYGGDGAEGSFIAVTNLLITSNQTKGVCPETTKAQIALCSKDSDCVKGTTSPMTSGVMTGKCVLRTGTCEVAAWCPVEQNTTPLKGKRPLLEGIEDFTVMIKNTVEFPDCGKDLHKRNILESATKEYLEHCMYNIKNDTSCPIFRLGDIVEWSGQNFSEVAKTGAVFRVEVNWECDFDWGGSSLNSCFPKYKFARVDESNAQISPGWNFRSANYYEDDRRTLTKFYGLKIIIEITGEGSRFDFFTLVVTIGATIGLFSLAPLTCDFLFELLCVLKRFKLFAKCFGDFSVKARYQNSEDILPSKVYPTKFELTASNNTLEESVASKM